MLPYGPISIQYLPTPETVIRMKVPCGQKPLATATPFKTHLRPVNNLNDTKMLRKRQIPITEHDLFQLILDI